MPVLDTLVRDLRHTVRLLTKTPAFTLAAATTLGLGIGANTAMFTLIDAVLVEPLPYRDPDRLVAIWSIGEARGTTHLSIREIAAYEDGLQSFERLSAYTETNASLTGEQEPERVRSAFVTPNLFETLGVGPIHGRPFAPGDAKAGDVALISQGLWERRFGGAPDVVGRSVRINGRARTVVGIMPASFKLPLDYRADRPTEVWLPLAIDRARPGEWGDRSYIAIGRLKAGIDRVAATRELTAMTNRWIEAAFPGFRGSIAARGALPLEQLITGSVRTPLVMLVWAVAGVLLIACANVVNLLLARADARRREIAIRAAVGASGGRLVGQLLTEAAVLSALGGVFGVAIAHGAMRLLVTLKPANLPRLDEVTLDLGVLAFTAVLSLASAVVFGLAPALQLTRPRLASILNDGGRSGTTGRSRRTVRRTLVVVQLAFSTVLVVAAALLARTLVELHRVDLGFDTGHILTFQLQLPPTDYPDDQRVVAFYKGLTEQVRQLPGVQHAGAIRVLPLARPIGNYSITIEGRTQGPNEDPNGDFQWATPGYFRVMGMTLLRGRFLSEDDGPEAPPVVVINDTMAGRYWPGEDAVGKRFHMGGGTTRPALTIVGIVRGTRHNAIVESARAEMYLPHAQLPASVGGAARTMAVVVKTTAPPEQVAGPIREAVRRIDPALPLSDVRTMDRIASAALATPRFAATLLGGFAALALALAAIGVYATVALLVTERSQEIGIRMALGARRRGVLALVLREGLILSGGGLAVGLIGAAIASSSLETLLYGVQRFDLATFLIVPAVLIAVALAACVAPARRAVSVDPVVALRQG
jgi:putative ABC transport system permease protein